MLTGILGGKYKLTAIEEEGDKPSGSGGGSIVLHTIKAVGSISQGQGAHRRQPMAVSLTPMSLPPLNEKHTLGYGFRVNQRNPEAGPSVEWAQPLQVTVA